MVSIVINNNNEMTTPSRNRCRSENEELTSRFVLDAEGFRQRAACVCVRTRREKEVLLVSSGRKVNLI